MERQLGAIYGMDGAMIWRHRIQVNLACFNARSSFWRRGRYKTEQKITHNEVTSHELMMQGWLTLAFKDLLVNVGNKAAENEKENRVQPVGSSVEKNIDL
ncbi:hypothetical protein Godav_023950, partial [Gossypium davidsonii]|nr:hypothetical protein [Gossypium davidsonii]